MRRIFLAVSAFALMLITADVASAQFRWGVGYGGGYWGTPGYSVSYGTRIGDGVLQVGYNYPAYGFYNSPVYYSTPYYYGYNTPYYYSPYYYSTPYYYSGYRWGWRWGW